jgi:hypothetical protein
LVFGIFSCLACGGEEQPQGGGIDKGGSGGTSGQGGTGGMVVLMPCTTCMPPQGSTEGCLFVSVTRANDVSDQPWTLFPAEADGRGTLVVAAYDGSGAYDARRTIMSADMTPSNAKYDLNLGCVPTGTTTLGVFLDDNEDATSSSVSSMDFHDSCPMDRSPMVSIVTNITTPVSVVLTNSCD